MGGVGGDDEELGAAGVEAREGDADGTAGEVFAGEFGGDDGVGAAVAVTAGITALRDEGGDDAVEDGAVVAASACEFDHDAAGFACAARFDGDDDTTEGGCDDEVAFVVWRMGAIGCGKDLRVWVDYLAQGSYLAFGRGEWESERSGQLYCLKSCLEGARFGEFEGSAEELVAGLRGERSCVLHVQRERFEQGRENAGVAMGNELKEEGSGYSRGKGDERC